MKTGWLQVFAGLLYLVISPRVLSAAAASPEKDPEKPQWALLWSDEFEGPVLGTDPSCFSRIPTCIVGVSSGVSRNCPESTWQNLSLLNKCNWSVLSFYNTMDQGVTEGNGINAFDPHEVIVRDGELILKAQSRGRRYADCGRTLGEQDSLGNRIRSAECPFMSGGVTSRSFQGSVKGLAIQFGRVEIRARLPQGPGSWPKYWMLPQEGSWPADGEIDLMDRKASHPWRVSGMLHGGEENSTVHLQARHDFYASQAFFRDYHVYAVEWSPREIRYFIDRKLIGITREGEIYRDAHTQRKMQIHIPTRPFYLILNSTIAPFSHALPWQRPDSSDFTPQDHHIDYVRVYRLIERVTEPVIAN